jgi:UPF0716 family protein affecting phage T7 exclusion
MRLLLLFTIIPIVEITLLVRLHPFLGWTGTWLLILGTAALGFASVAGPQIQKIATDKVPTGELVEGAIVQWARTMPGIQSPDSSAWFRRFDAAWHLRSRSGSNGRQ